MKWLIAVLLFSSVNAFADDFSKADLERWQKEFDSVAAYGRTLWTNSAKVKLGTNGVACAQCHPNGANTHPETYPKFQKQLGKVANFWEMVNWCVRNPLQAKVGLAADSKEMTALVAYATKERRGVKLEPGKH